MTTRVGRVSVLLLVGVLLAASQADAQRRERNRRNGGGKGKKVSTALVEAHRRHVEAQVRRVLDSGRLTPEQELWAGIGLADFLASPRESRQVTSIESDWVGTSQDLSVPSAVGGMFRSQDASMTQAAAPLLALGKLTCLVGDELFLTGRFIATATFQHSVTGEIGLALACPLTPFSGYFFFGLDRTNVEVPIKMLNACSHPSPRYWMFAAGLTDFGVQITIFDLATGIAVTYTNPTRTFFQPIIDQNTPFPC